ncbi:hypothetical protein LTSEGIV_0306 [Salmonella enterica subsp. enterica serovar Give str. S5-487]|nr:hypothetical protein LTSEGIV_0306 [Salmonella enterica subsp. enterica serovar Give str. S5-487]
MFFWPTTLYDHDHFLFKKICFHFLFKKIFALFLKMFAAFIESGPLKV